MVEQCHNRYNVEVQIVSAYVGKVYRVTEAFLWAC